MERHLVRSLRQTVRRLTDYRLRWPVEAITPASCLYHARTIATFRELASKRFTVSFFIYSPTPHPVPIADVSGVISVGDFPKERFPPLVWLRQRELTLAPFSPGDLTVEQRLPDDIAEETQRSFSEGKQVTVIFSFVTVRSSLALKLWDGAVCQVPDSPVVTAEVRLAAGRSGR